MSKIVVLGLDGSQDSIRAIPYAAEQAGADGKIVAVHVRGLLIGRAGGLPLVANENEVEMDVVSAVAGGPANVIADIARAERADVIVVGTRGHRQIANLIVGSVTHRLLHMTPCPVLAVPPAASAAAGGARPDAVAAGA